MQEVRHVPIYTDPLTTEKKTPFPSHADVAKTSLLSSKAIKAFSASLSGICTVGSIVAYSSSFIILSYILAVSAFVLLAAFIIAVTYKPSDKIVKTPPTPTHPPATEASQAAAVSSHNPAPSQLTLDREKIARACPKEITTACPQIAELLLNFNPPKITEVNISATSATLNSFKAHLVSANPSQKSLGSRVLHLKNVMNCTLEIADNELYQCA